MKKIKLNNLILLLYYEKDGVRVMSSDRNVLIMNQSIENINELLLHNFNIVYTFFKDRVVRNHLENFDEQDLTQISISIILYFLFMYNQWNNMYKKSNYELKFHQDDFEYPYTQYIIIDYFKNKYPDSWKLKCSIILDLSLERLEFVNLKKEEFEDK